MAWFFRCPLCDRVTTWADDEDPREDPAYAHEPTCFVLSKPKEVTDDADGVSV